jgi:molybdate transport system substrate-binding protein
VTRGARGRRRALAPTWVVAVLAVAGCARADRASDPLLVFAAADLRDALGDVARAYRAAGGDSAVLVFGSTGDLATQLANGAPADVFFAASASAVDGLAARRRVVDGTRADYALGRLALVARCPAPGRIAAAPAGGGSGRDTTRCPTLTLADLGGPQVRTVAVANPAHAPYGVAAREALERSGLWTRVRPKLVLGANISQAEQFVASGNADAGLVALSLVLRAPGRPYTLVDSALHEPLRQTAVVIAGTARAAGAERFLRYVTGPAGQRVMRRYGFTLPAAVDAGAR